MTLEPHTLYIIPKMQYHRIDYIRQEGNANIFNMSVSESFFEHNIATYSSSLMEAIRGKDCLYVRLEQVSYEFLLMLSRKATYDKDANQRLQATRLFLTAAATLYQACEINDDALSQPRRYALDIKTKIDNLEYIENDVASIYEHYPLAPSLLIRNFKDLTGKTIIKYQVERRMKYACALLTNTDYTILRISSMVGYDSLSHFTENFRKFYGTTPAAYRKEISAHLRGAAEGKTRTNRSTQNAGMFGKFDEISPTVLFESILKRYFPVVGKIPFFYRFTKHSRQAYEQTNFQSAEHKADGRIFTRDNPNVFYSPNALPPRFFFFTKGYVSMPSRL